MQRGLKYLYATQKADGSWSAPQAQQYAGGLESLALLAALETGAKPADAPFARGLKYVMELQPNTVYARSMRVLLLTRLDPNAHAEAIAEDARWIARQQNTRNGGWGYGPTHPTTMQDRTYADSSNTMLAVHALSEAHLAGAKIPAATWERAREFWADSQNADGGWGYLPPGGRTFRVKPSSYGTTVAGGMLNLLELTDQWARGNPIPGEAPPTKKTFAPAADWMHKNYVSAKIPQYIWGSNTVYYYYYLHALAQAANNMGTRRFGKTAWVEDVLGELLSQQLRDGSWIGPEPGDVRQARPTGDGPVCTALAMLTLHEAARPVLLNRLRFQAEFTGEFRDAASAARWYSGHVRPVTWRWVTSQSPLGTLREAPLLYLNATENVSLDEKVSARLRAFVQCGGTLLVQGRQGDSDFNRQLIDFLKGIFPKLSAQVFADDHPVFTAEFPIPRASRPRLVGLGDGWQVRVVVATSDLSGALHSGSEQREDAAGRFIANLALYATDKRGPGHRLIGHLPPEEVKTERWITIGRAKHRGDWNTCATAVPRLSAALANAISVGLKEKPVSLDSPVPEDLPLLWLTGNRPAKLSDTEKKNLRSYVLGGGTVLIDPGAGSEAFHSDITETLVALFDASSLKPIRPRHPLLTGKFADGLGSSIRKVSYTRAVAAEKPTLNSPALLGIHHKGRLAIIVSRYGLSCPVEGLPTWNVRGLSTDDARRLVLNAILYATTHEESTPTPRTRPRL
ncbi:MAG: DUF4159 domain-containing protein [Phycisphaerae bacterium]